MKLSKAEAALLLFLLESFLPEPDDVEAAESLLEKLQRMAPAAPFGSATEARRSRSGAS